MDENQDANYMGTKGNETSDGADIQSFGGQLNQFNMVYTVNDVNSLNQDVSPHLEPNHVDEMSANPEVNPNLANMVLYNNQNVDNFSTPNATCIPSNAHLVGQQPFWQQEQYFVQVNTGNQFAYYNPHMQPQNNYSIEPNINSQHLQPTNEGMGQVWESNIATNRLSDAVPNVANNNAFPNSMVFQHPQNITYNEIYMQKPGSHTQITQKHVQVPIANSQFNSMPQMVYDHNRGVGNPAFGTSQELVLQRKMPPLRIWKPPLSGVMYTLSNPQRRHFYDHGYIHLSDQIDVRLLKPLIGLFESSSKTAVSENFIEELFCNTSIASLVGSLLGSDYFIPDRIKLHSSLPGSKCQISIMRNGDVRYEPSTQWNVNWRLNGLKKRRNYTIWVTIFLSRFEPNCGNLVLRPGSHKEIEKIVSTNHGLVQLLNHPKVYLPLKSIGMQLVAKPGDILLCHYQVAKTYAPNASSDATYMVTFEVYSRSHMPNTFKPEILRNIFMDYHGLDFC